MTRRITCYAVFVTLIWGAHTDYEEKVRDMFKSNMTRNDFSNLLNSLIKLNEQRVSVLQKLYRLDDYGVLSEVLRSGDKKTGNGNPANLFLIVMSKNQNDPSRRKIGFQLVDSVSSLNAGSNNNHSKLDFVLDLAGYFTQNIRKDNRLLDSIFGNFPRVGLTETRADDGSKKINPTKETLKFNLPGLRATTRPKANEESKYHKENSRHEIVNNKGRLPNTNEKLLGYDGNRKHSQTVGYNSQSNEYVETDFTIENEKLTTKPNINKHIISSNHQHSKYPSKGKDEDDYGSSLSHVKNYQNRQYTKIISDISNKKYHDINHFNPKTNTYTPKVKVQSNQQNDKLTTKPIIIKDILSSNHKNSKYPLEGSPFSDIENGHNSHYTKIISDIPKHHVNNHQKLKTTTKPITIIDIITSNHKNTKYPSEGKDEPEEDDYGYPFSNIENDHYSQYTKKNSDISIKKHHNNNHKTNKYTTKVKVQSNQQNDKLTTKPITIKDIITSNHKNTKYPLEGKDELDEDYYGSPFSNIENDHYSQYSDKNSDIFIKKLHVNNHNNPKTIENTSKGNRQPKLNQNKSILNNQDNKYSKIKSVKTTTPKNYYRINGTVKKASEKNQVIKNPNLNHNNTNANNHDNIYTNIKYEYATKDTKLPSLASENVYGSKPVISETTKDTQNESYPDYDYRIIGTVKKASQNNQVIKNLNLNHSNTNANNDDLTYTSIKDEYATKDIKLPSLASENVYGSKPVISEITKDTANGRYPDFGDRKDMRDNSNKDKPETVTDTLYGNYPNIEDHKDVRDNSNKGKTKTAKDTPFENDPGFENLKVVRDKSNTDKPVTTIGSPFGNNFHGFEHHNNVKKNLNKLMSNTVRELYHRNNSNVKSKKDPDYYGVKMFDNGKTDEAFSVFITNVGNRTAEEVKQQNDSKLTPNAFDKPRSKHIARKPFAKCLNKKALKLCSKSCISAYKNVCRKLKCTSRSKRALKSECKRSCKKTFASSSSKYSDKYSDEYSSSDGSDEYSDESDSDY